MANRDRLISVGRLFTRPSIIPSEGDHTFVIHALFQGDPLTRVLEGQSIPIEETRVYSDFGMWRINPRTREGIGLGGGTSLSQLEREHARWGRRLTREQFNIFCNSLPIGSLREPLRESYGTSRRVPWRDDAIE